MTTRLFFLLLFSLVAIMAVGQTNDFGIWTTVEARKELGRWDLSGETELRTKENSSAIDRASIGFSGAFRLIKPLKIGAGYDFIYFNDSEYADYQPRHRVHLFLQGKMKTGDFSFSLKEKVQMTAKDVSDRIKENGNTDNYQVNPAYTWRNKFDIAYNIPHFPVNPSLSVETFYSLNNPDGNSFEKLRYTFSLGYKLMKGHRVGLSAIYNQKLNDASADNRFVLAFGYQIKF